MTASPLYRDTFALCGVLLEEVEASPGFTVLRRRLAEAALRLLEDISLALAGFERLEAVTAADAELRMLRTHLQLAYELEVFGEETFLALAEQANTVGRQLGGWLKKLTRDGD